MALSMLGAILMMMLLPAGLGARTAATTGTPPATPAATLQPNIGINGFFSADKAQRGSTVQAAVVVDVPQGFHINANRLLGKIGIPTSLKVEAPGGARVGPIVYPRPVVRRLKVSDEQLALYEGRAVLRFNVTFPAGFQEGMTQLRARLRYQSCNDEVCFPPVTREVEMPIGVVGSGERVRRINGNIFGGGGRRRG